MPKSTSICTPAVTSTTRWLGVVGSAKSVPALAALLSDPDLAHPARMALEPMANADAGTALRAALGKVQGKLLSGVIASIGARRDPQARANDILKGYVSGDRK